MAQALTISGTAQVVAPVATPDATVLSDIRSTILFGVGAVAATFGVFGIWAATTELARGTHASAEVVVETRVKRVQHLEGGIVSSVLVRNGDLVEAGDVLIRLDATEARVRHEILVNRRDDFLAIEARLTAERDQTTEIHFPDALTERADNLRVRELMADQAALLVARHEEREGRIAILERRIDQFGKQIEGFEAQREANIRQTELIQEELVGLRSLHDKGYAPRTRVLALDRSMAGLRGSLGELTAEIARAEVAIGEAQDQILQLSHTARKEAVDQLGTVRSRLSEIAEQIAAARQVLDRVEVRAPAGGEVVELAVHSPGAVVGPGQVLMEIVPRDDRLVIEARISPLERDSVEIGMAADVNFPGLPRRTTPTLEGRMVTISADAVSADRRTPNAPSFFVAQIEISEEELARLDDVTLAPGMPANVLIKAGHRTVLSYLIDPWSELFRKAMRED